jgi:hypothetical protein
VNRAARRAGPPLGLVGAETWRDASPDEKAAIEALAHSSTLALPPEPTRAAGGPRRHLSHGLMDGATAPRGRRGEDRREGSGGGDRFARQARGARGHRPDEEAAPIAPEPGTRGPFSGQRQDRARRRKGCPADTSPLLLVASFHSRPDRAGRARGAGLAGRVPERTDPASRMGTVSVGMAPASRCDSAPTESIKSASWVGPVGV